MEYNSKKKYNFRSDKGGATYNSASFTKIITLYDSLSSQDIIEDKKARMVLGERISPLDDMMFRVLFELKDRFNLIDFNMERSILFELIERLNTKDSLSDVVAFIKSKIEEFKIKEISDIKALYEYKDIFSSEENYWIDAILYLKDKLGAKDLQEFINFIESFEYIQMEDKEPRTALSDFFIGAVDDLDRAYDWLVPFDLIVDWRNTSIQIMPQTESDYIDIPNVDGSMIENTVYKNRLFNIVAWSRDGMTIQEKESLKKDIAYILDSTKDKTRKLTFSSSGNSFDVKYSGLLNIQEAPSSIKATIPFETAPYGHPLVEQEVDGNGLIINNGDKDVGAVHKIKGGCVKPNFQLGNITYLWKGTVPTNSTLYIDHNNFSCYLETTDGQRTNALNKLEGEFQKIPKGKSLPITCYGDTAKYITTSIEELILW